MLYKEMEEYINIRGILDSIDTYASDWGKFDIKRMSRLERDDLAYGLELIIKEIYPSFKGSVNDNDIFVYNEIIKDGMTNNRAARFAAEMGSLNLLKYYIILGADLPSLYQGVVSRNEEVIDYLIKNGKDDYFYGLLAAASIGDTKIFDKIYALTPPEEKLSGFHSNLLEEGVKGGHLEIVNKIIKLINDFKDYDQAVEYYNWALKFAAENGDEKIMDILLKRVTSHNHGLYGAARRGDKRIFDKMLDLYQREGYDNKDQEKVYYRALIEAGTGGNLDIIKTLLYLYRHNPHIDYAITNVINEAAENGHLQAIKFLLSKKTERLDLDYALWKAAVKGYKDIVKLLLENGAEDFDFVISQVKSANHPEIVELIKSYQKL